MGWTFTDRQVKPVVKYEGKCKNPAKHKFCPYWFARHDAENNNLLKYRCDLFKEDKDGYASVKACDDKYGLSYDGLP